MNRKYVHTFMILFCMVIVACGTEGADGQGEADIIGYVLDKKDRSIFVVSKQAQDFSANDGLNEYYDAIWLSEAPEDIEIGEQVKIWYDGPVQESYPMGGKVGKLEVVPGNKHEGADWSEAEAIDIAIQQQKPNEHIAVKSIEFDKELAFWKIEFKELPDGDVYQVQVQE